MKQITFDIFLSKRSLIKYMSTLKPFVSGLSVCIMQDQ